MNAIMSAIPSVPTKQTGGRTASGTAILRLWKRVFLSGIVTFAVLSAIITALLAADFFWRLSGAAEGLNFGPGSLIFSVSFFGEIVALAVAVLGAVGWLITWCISLFWRAGMSTTMEGVEAASITSQPSQTVTDNPYEAPRSYSGGHRLYPLAILAAGVFCTLMSLLYLLTGFHTISRNNTGSGPRPEDSTFHFVIAAATFAAAVMLFRAARRRRVL
ncbi:MAG: hypothetical protein KF708_22970, partial [Pirellulales bacterium]|nr:hypothetical protein [Pirellulales bacterium]